MSVPLPWPAAPWIYTADTGTILGNDGGPVLYVSAARMSHGDLIPGKIGTATKIGHLVAAAPDLFEAVRQSAVDLAEAAKIMTGGGAPALGSVFEAAALRNLDLLAKARGEPWKRLGTLTEEVVGKVQPQPEKNDV